MGTGRRPGSPEAAWLFAARARAAPLPRPLSGLTPNAAEPTEAPVVQGLPEGPSRMPTPQRRRKGSEKWRGEGDPGAERRIRAFRAWAVAAPRPAGATYRQLRVLGPNQVCSEYLQVQGSHRKGTLPPPTDVPDLRIVNS